MIHVLLPLLVACGEPAPEAELQLDGPARVRVDQLGPVPSPKVVLDDGSAPEGITWTVSDDSVARVVDGVVVAQAPGEVQVIGASDAQEVSWTLIVDPAMVLGISGAPSTLGVGDTLQLQAVASIGDSSVDAGPVVWTSSDPDVLALDPDGAATALGVGRVWITVRSPGGSSSMVELDVE